MAVIVPWQPDTTWRQVLAHLAVGECVALPTESTYELAASALHEHAVSRLTSAAGDQAVAIALTDTAEVVDWLPLLTGAGARLVRKLGAGPYVLQADAGYRTGLFPRLPGHAQAMLAFNEGVRIRLADHPIWSELRRLGLPLMSVSLPTAADASQAAHVLGEQAALIVDSGPVQFAQAPSMVQADGRRAMLIREGGLTREQFAEVALCRILFVCTGNTCRSPMAEALCIKLLSDRLGCAAGELKRHGYVVQSAGLAASAGCEASPEGAQVVADMGADLSRHRSCMVTVDQLLWADHIFAMTAGHWYTLRSADVPGLPTPEMLSPQYEDVADPIGRARIDYQTCAQQILHCLNQRLPQLLES